MTNGDKIRQMSNEELAEWIDKKFELHVACHICADVSCEGNCIDGIKAYLEMEAE